MHLFETSPWRDMKLLLIFVIFIFSNCSYADNTHQFYEFRTQISLTKQVFDRWDLNVFTSQNANLVDKTYGGEHAPTNIQNYFLVGPTYKYSSNLNFVFLGYIYQKTNPLFDNFVNENRLFQQVVYSSDFGFGRVTHRVRFEQRFIHDKAPEQKFLGTRLRYQLGLLVPLQGEELNNGEFYLNTYNEFYFITSGVSGAIYNENWAYAGIGYQTAKYGRFEVGPLLQRVVVDKHDIRYFNLLQFSWSHNFD
ncbi:DUF2490 domain-containing protein [Nitrosospira sp. Nsp13]|uniref:DUF2490 domain-containing protein n=1 Tax=Nitrosospira sp. Nsp13 TaxID=1855332 RepID=UPI0008869F83|nr:DUF2490 domain-containing protein [Nitrosospira sp. Nsp13]SCX85097.1 Protein of unknown function [Nitrosospira sp. Nsp13]